MSHVISFDGEPKPIDIHTKQGAYEHIALFLRQHAAPSLVFSSLEKLFPGHTEKAANYLWASVSDILTQDQIERLEGLHKADLNQLGVI